MKYTQLRKDHLDLLEESQQLRDENKRLKEEFKNSRFSYSNVKSSMVKMLFFTGITSVLFDWLCTKITDSVNLCCKKLTIQDHLLIVLMKLRLGLTNTDLAYRFEVSKSTLSNICRSWIPAMAEVLRPAIKWPSKEATLRFMPKFFKRRFRKCRCVIDCTEIFIHRPSHMTSRSQSWSNYKHNNTMKYLIGITPAGAISFLSEGWGGRASDKRMTKESGFYDLVEFRDEIIADRGFLISDELAARGATLRVPAFTKGKRQLSAHQSIRQDNCLV